MVQQPQTMLSLPQLTRGGFPGQRSSSSSNSTAGQLSCGNVVDTQQQVPLCVPGTSTCSSEAAITGEAAEPPEVLVLLFDREHDVVISGGNEGAVRVSLPENA